MLRRNQAQLRRNKALLRHVLRRNPAWLRLRLRTFAALVCGSAMPTWGYSFKHCFHYGYTHTLIVRRTHSARNRGCRSSAAVSRYCSTTSTPPLTCGSVAPPVLPLHLRAVYNVVAELYAGEVSLGSGASCTGKPATYATHELLLLANKRRIPTSRHPLLATNVAQCKPPARA